MITLGPKEEHLRQVLSDTITLLCRNLLDYSTKIDIDAVIGVTLDEKSLFYIPIKATHDQVTLQAQNKALSKTDKASQQIAAKTKSQHVSKETVKENVSSASQSRRSSVSSRHQDLKTPKEQAKKKKSDPTIIKIESDNEGDKEMEPTKKAAASQRKPISNNIQPKTAAKMTGSNPATSRPSVQTSRGSNKQSVDPVAVMERHQALTNQLESALWNVQPQPSQTAQQPRNWRPFQAPRGMQTPHGSRQFNPHVMRPPHLQSPYPRPMNMRPQRLNSRQQVPPNTRPIAPLNTTNSYQQAEPESKRLPYHPTLTPLPTSYQHQSNQVQPPKVVTATATQSEPTSMISSPRTSPNITASANGNNPTESNTSGSQDALDTNSTTEQQNFTVLTDKIVTVFLGSGNLAELDSADTDLPPSGISHMVAPSNMSQDSEHSQQAANSTTTVAEVHRSADSVYNPWAEQTTRESSLKPASSRPTSPHAENIPQVEQTPSRRYPVRKRKMSALLREAKSNNVTDEMSPGDIHHGNDANNNEILEWNDVCNQSKKKKSKIPGSSKRSRGTPAYSMCASPHPSSTPVYSRVAREHQERTTRTAEDKLEELLYSDPKMNSSKVVMLKYDEL